MRSEKNQKLIRKIAAFVQCYKTEPTGREVDGTVELLEEISDYLKEEGMSFTIDAPGGMELTAEAMTDEKTGKPLPEILLSYREKNSAEQRELCAWMKQTGFDNQLRLFAADNNGCIQHVKLWPVSDKKAEENEK